MATAKRELTDTRVQGRPDHRLMLPAEAAELLRISLSQLYHLTSERRIAFLKVGGQLRFERDALLASAAEAARARAPRRGARNGGHRIAQTPAVRQSAAIGRASASPRRRGRSEPRHTCFLC